MPTSNPNRKPDLSADRRRALQVLAGSPDGATEAVMRAHGFTVELLLDLFRDGLVTAKVERMSVADRWINVVRVRITDAGRRVLAELR